MQYLSVQTTKMFNLKSVIQLGAFIHFLITNFNFKVSVGDIGVNINNFLCSIRKKYHNTPRQLLVSDMV